MNDIIYQPASSLVAAIRRKQVSAREVVEAHLARIAEVNPRLNAVVQLPAERARLRAKQADEALARREVWGPLHGLPFTVKDSLCTAGVVTTAGTAGRAEFIPQWDATVVARLKAAGAILLGKTNCSELCASGETDNAVYGRTNNPYDLDCATGGSSGGEVAIIAAGGSPLGLASDFGGSIRGPAHFCGVAGLNPTLGRVPRSGHIPPYAGAYDTARIGPVARHVQDLALVLPLIAGPDGVDPSVIDVASLSYDQVDLARLRVAFHIDNGVWPVTPDTARVVRDAAQALKDSGIAVMEAPPPPELRDLMLVADALASARGQAEKAGIFSEFRQDRPVHREALGEYADLWLRRSAHPESAGGMPATEFLAWTWKWDLCKSAMLAYLEPFDAILCAVDPDPALPHGFTSAPDFPNWRVTGYTKPYSMVGWPSVVVRAGNSTEGLPIGVQVVAAPWREDLALAVAQIIEKELGGWQPPPL